jgi:hypothetical protein
MTLKNRLVKLEKIKEVEEPTVVTVDWGGPTLTVNGEELTRAEYQRRYPHALVIEVSYRGENDDQD